MSKTTRTLNPLHFEDLEPHRFEDMVRQLAYDFRTWRSIEATGRLGADEGIDIRAVEVTGAEPWPSDDQGEDETTTPGELRLWIIQCKREQRLGPADMRKIVKDAVPAGGEPPYGFIISAACDFSTKARHAFREEGGKHGVRETHVWGKAELEDMLFLPKNDHLLFAYFDISLQVRRRSLRTEVRSRLAMKRMLTKTLGALRQRNFKTVLIRDPREERYPYEEKIPDFKVFPRWKDYTLWGHYPPDHLAFVVGRFFAYFDSDKRWDAMFGFNDARPPTTGNPFAVKVDQEHYEKRQRYCSFWEEKVPAEKRATFFLLKFIHYDRILAVDEEGDSAHEGPHVLVEFDRENGPFDPHRIAQCVEQHVGITGVIGVGHDDRIEFFPKEFRSYS